MFQSVFLDGAVVATYLAKMPNKLLEKERSYHVWNMDLHKAVVYNVYVTNLNDKNFVDNIISKKNQVILLQHVFAVDVPTVKKQENWNNGVCIQIKSLFKVLLLII